MKNRCAERDESMASELKISGGHLLVALAGVVSIAGPLVWVIVRFWLFAV